MKSSTGTTGVLIIHNDCSLLQETLESAKHIIDSLVVVDGAYEWVAPFCEMNSENPEKSTDNLLNILEDSGIPYKYHGGIWRNETHKRLASLEFVKTNRVMLIDSDEIYNVDQGKLEAFWSSGKVLASLEAPLFIHDDVVTLHTASNAYPRKTVFLNLSGQDLQKVVSSLWLLLPDSEKGEIIDRKLIERIPLGIFYHLSMFRTDNNPYRRSRFYNLLSMRVAGKIGLDINQDFSNDDEFTELIQKSNRVAMNNMFTLHRLAASFPQQKQNQELVVFDFENLLYRDIVVKSYNAMLADQRARTENLQDTSLEVFSGRSLFLDVTSFLSEGKSCLKINLDQQSTFKIIWHIDCGTSRYDLESYDIMFPKIKDFPGFKRLIAEIVVKSVNMKTTSLSFSIS